MERFDVILIGSGLGGLSAAARLAREGKRVLVLERNGNFGGAATVYTHGLLAIEASLHETDTLGLKDPAHGILHLMGIADKLELVEAREFYEVRSALLPQPFQLPRGFDAAVEAAVEAFPTHEEGVRRYFRTLQAILKTMHAVGDETDHRLKELLGVVHGGELWEFLKRTRSNVQSALDDFFGDAEACKLALAPNLAYFDDEPSRMWFPVYAMVQGRYLTEGGHYFRGGSRALTMALIEVVQAAGGVALTKTEATGIVLNEEGQAVGVEWRDASGESHEAVASVVLGNAAPTVLAQMLPAYRREEFLEPYAANAPSISLFTISLGVNRLPSEHGVSAYSTFVFPDWMTKYAQYAESAALLGSDPGERIPYYVIADYSRVATGLNEEGLHLVTITGIDRLSHWEGLTRQDAHARKERWMDALIADVDRRYPGFSTSIVQREMSTAMTMHRYLNTPNGSVYGFAPSAERYMRGPTPKTKVEGLLLSSAYTMSGGFRGSMMGGMLAAREASRYLAEKNGA